jgi:hypothetical protein
MPDLLMCESTVCPRSGNCFRHADSGTRPDAGQRYGRFKPYWFSACRHYLPAINADGSPRLYIQTDGYAQNELGIHRAGSNRAPMAFIGSPQSPEQQAELEAMRAEGWVVYGPRGLRQARKQQRHAASKRRS